MLVGSCRRKEKIKGKFHELYYIFGGLTYFSPKKYVIAGNIYGMSEEKIKQKLNSLFFLVRHDSSTLEELSTIEYNATLMYKEQLIECS